MHGISNKLIKGSMWLSLSRAIVNGLAMFSTVILARYLAPSDFGLVALGTTMLALMTSATELSLTQALIRHAAPSESHFSSAWTLNGARGLLILILFTAASYPVSRLYNEARLVEVMLALGLSAFLGSLINPRLIVFQRKLIFWQEFALNVSQKLIGFIVAVTVAVLYHSYWALVIGTLASQATNLIVSYVILPFRPSITFRHAREFFSFSAWLSASQIANTLNWRFDDLLIGKVLGATSLGFYAVGNNLAVIPTREATAPLRQTIYPSFASIRHDAPRLAAAYQRIQALVTALALPAGIGFAVIADRLVLLALGDKWAPVTFIIQTLASIFAIQTLGSLVQPLGIAKGETRLLFTRDMQMLALRIPALCVGMYFWGLHGFVWARVLSGLLAALINMVLVRRLVGLTIMQQLSANGRALISVALMAAGLVLISHYLPSTASHAQLALQLAIQVFCGALLYCGGTISLWVAMGRPSGAEADFLMILAKISGKLRPSTKHNKPEQ